ncbi:hybrid sensor histidine kinase/response regulator transcription factor [uncultured Bacteroides sp.]|uniref:hybrid sensor histidine kinase/response regulator transcription factor n=1 Tax=uncultured Bacteroides sp. TaxID=162156 RepID=UPI000822F1D2|nr:hybrid sensor histidine kinase/response regulator transcription factor [uncultured Bacteroides sp.]SCK00703.1 Sensor protein evgS precursor [uncultured Bacteroides sp.]
MKVMFTMKEKIWSFVFCFGIFFPLVCQAIATPKPNTLVFKSSSILNSLPSKDVQSVYQDRDGYIWISTRNGLFQYDGYSLTTYKSNLFRTDLLTNNNVFCVAEDAKHRLWIGTYSGLNVLDKKTGAIRKIDHPEMNGNSIPQVLITSDERILFATDWGVYEYQEDKDDFLCHGGENTGNVMPRTAIKSLFEDDRGDIWIGTWDAGLYRYEKKTGKYFRYPRLNEQNSAHYVFQDSQKNIWVGTWRGGLVLLKDAYQPDKTTWITYRYDEKNLAGISDDIIYALSEDLNTHSLWVGTRKGLSVLPLTGNYTGAETFSNYYPSESDSSIASDEVASLLRDRQGLMWVGMIGGGVNKVSTRKADFYWDQLLEVKRMLKTTSVRSILLDDEGLLWLGIGTYGLGVKNRQTGKFTYYTQMPEFDRYRGISTVMSMMQHSVTGHIWIAAYDGGVYEVDKKAPVAQRVRNYYAQDAPWLAGSCVFHIYEDSKHNLWFATRNGVSMRTMDGEAVRLDTLQVGNSQMRNVPTMYMTEGNDGDMWVASNTHGVFRLHCDEKGSYTVSCYSATNGKLNSVYADCLYTDAKGRIWVGTGGSGLNLYDEATDTFLPVHAKWNLPGDAVVSIRSDKEGDLWLGTNAGLIKLALSDNLESATFRLYTTVDGLQDNIFIRSAQAVAVDGEMFFGGHRGYNSFYPENQQEQPFSSSVIVTDIKIFNQSWGNLPAKERMEISELSPAFADEIQLDHWHNNFSIEFSALEYANPERNQYAYQLAGFDSDWQYTGGAKRFAYYNNLKPGTYTFQLKASNANGIWDENVQTVKVVILPPPWKTWWAYTLYIIILVGIAGYIYRIIRNRIRLRNALHLREMEQAKSEEINHAKLQFFTNITHELLTPLTIISASVDELKQTAPAYKEQYDVMTHNINRLIRLLQQILEFRKAETGNLKLKVLQGDLVLFVRRSLDGFRPLMKKKDIHFTIQSSMNKYLAFFDPDKLDKILYNLLSNASKYNKPGGKVGIELSCDEANGVVCIIVKDNGPGIPKESQKNLFKRFYEGDYRKFNTIGTGIGLSLVRDLVVLHHGSISVESEEGKGTAFKIEFPVHRFAYSEEEIDDAVTLLDSDGIDAVQEDVVIEDIQTSALEDNVVSAEQNVAEKSHTLLLVEDNEDLLGLMVKLLGTDYKIHTATNGKEALEIVESEDIDLIVSDVMMPVMDGIEFCRSIKGNFDTSHIPLILLTAKKQEEDRVEAYESGADAFITKPFNLSVLHARIGNLLKSRERVMKDFKKQLVFEAKELNYTSMDEDFLQRAIDCVNRHLDDPGFDQTQFLEEMNTTKSTFFRKLKSLTGLTYVSFIRNIRMKAACHIMEEKKHVRISELAYAVGYNDPRYFSSIFKKEIGMQPSEYMERFTSGGTIEGE